MNVVQENFVCTLVTSGALRFGDFTTKAGRRSPYFVNFGHICDGSSLVQVGEVYAQALISEFGDACDGIFGPAYKGISLAVATATALQQKHGKNIAVCYNRKEQKSHGEGGSIIGWTPTPGARVVIVDDVISRGTSIQESLKAIQSLGATVSGILVGLDREEAGYNGRRASEEVSDQLGVAVKSVVRLRDVLEFLENRSINGQVWLSADTRKKIETYVLDTYR